MPDKVERDGQTARRLVSPGEFHASRHLPGAVFPNYELSDDTGKHRQLSELKGPDPMILVFSRGGFCPKNRRRAETSDQNPLRIDIFVRCGTQGAEDLEIAEYTDPAHDPIIPHIIVPRAWTHGF